MILSYKDANSTCNKIDFTRFGVLLRKCSKIRKVKAEELRRYAREQSNDEKW